MLFDEIFSSCDILRELLVIHSWASDDGPRFRSDWFSFILPVWVFLGSEWAWACSWWYTRALLGGLRSSFCPLCVTLMELYDLEALLCSLTLLELVSDLARGRPAIYSGNNYTKEWYFIKLLWKHTIQTDKIFFSRRVVRMYTNDYAFVHDIQKYIWTINVLY